MHSELLKLVKCTTGAVLDTDDIAIPARFVDIGVDNAPASEKVFHNEVANHLFHNEWDKSGICDRSQLNGRIKGRASNIFIISNSFAVDCLPVI